MIQRMIHDCFLGQPVVKQNSHNDENNTTDDHHHQRDGNVPGEKEVFNQF